MTMELNRDSLIGEVLFEYPELQEVMLKHFGEEVACVMCPGQSFDTFGMIAELHSIDEASVEAMLQEMCTVITELETQRQTTNVS